ncbi:hypothetical protein MA16_Dca018708 [Dendrobium catenatum]|uniref:Uncharacterized protein n=1 Tax=Dendrobium catenatum TaxID=906689 RepID=A0A2I0VUY2_9ASPA|nr:hypothetical protein MA16_Dca018708 [Dendrobium catenatum]
MSAGLRTWKATRHWGFRRLEVGLASPEPSHPREEFRLLLSANREPAKGGRGRLLTLEKENRFVSSGIPELEGDGRGRSTPGGLCERGRKERSGFFLGIRGISPFSGFIYTEIISSSSAIFPTRIESQQGISCLIIYLEDYLHELNMKKCWPCDGGRNPVAVSMCFVLLTTKSFEMRIYIRPFLTNPNGQYAFEGEESATGAAVASKNERVRRPNELAIEGERTEEKWGPLCMPAYVAIKANIGGDKSLVLLCRYWSFSAIIDLANGHILGNLITHLEGAIDVRKIQERTIITDQISDSKRRYMPKHRSVRNEI